MDWKRALDFKRYFSAEQEELNRSWDWLTALSPLLLMMVVNYRWTAVWTVLFAAIAYLGGMKLWHLIHVTSFHPAPALVCGVLVACCLPTGSLWLSALAGLVGAAVSGLPVLLGRVIKKKPVACPVYLPALVGYLVVRWAFAARFARTILPAMGVRADAVAGATPLVTMGEAAVTPDRLRWMFWGYESGSMGSGPAVAVLLCCGYLLLRRRVRPIPTAAMLFLVAVTSWIWQGTPAFGVLVGGSLLAAVLLGEGALIPVGWKGQLFSGAVAGIVAVWCRLFYHTDGAAVGVVLSCVLTTAAYFFYPTFRRFVAFLREKFAKYKNKC